MEKVAGPDHHCTLRVLRVREHRRWAGKSRDINPLETYPLTWTCIVTGIPTRSSDFYWNRSPTSSEYLPWLAWMSR